MTKLNNITVLLASVAFAGAAFAGPSTTNSDNWRSGHDNLQWKSTSGECWQDTAWTPGTATAGCGAPVAAAPAKKMPAKVAAPAIPAAVAAVTAAEPVPEQAAPAPVIAQKINLAADAYFDTNKAMLKAEGRAKLDELASKLGMVNVETIVASGHTDSRGSDASNMSLSQRRANAVKAYLASRGVATDRILAEGKGESQLAVNPENTANDLAANRRVTVEVVGTKK